MPDRKPYEPTPTISRRDVLVDGSDAGFRETIYALVQSVGRLLMCRDAFARELDLTPTQFAVLLGVAQCQGRQGIAIGELAAHVSLAPTHVTTEVGRLATAGLLEKSPDPDDRRSVRVSLAPLGEEEVERVAPLVRRVNDALFDGVDEQDLAVMRRVARRIVVNAETAAAVIRKERLTRLETERASGRRAG